MTLMKKKTFVDAAYISEGLLTYGYSLQFLKEIFAWLRRCFGICKVVKVYFLIKIHGQCS